MTENRKRFRYFGADTRLTPVAKAIMDEDIYELDALLGKAWFLNEPFEFCEYCDGLAIQLALVESRHSVIDYLLNKNVDLNVTNAPAIVSSVTTLDTEVIDKLLYAGANLRARNNVGYDALDQCVAWEHFELVPYLESKGLSIHDHEGAAFNKAVFGGNLDFVEYALKKGRDPDRKKSHTLGGSGEAPLHSAVLKKNLNMIKLLLQYGADPTQGDENGQRPYHWALNCEEGDDDNTEITNFLRSIEPNILHDPKAKRELAERHHAPIALIAFLESEHRHFKTDDGYDVADFLALKDLYEFHWMEREYLMISRCLYDEFSIYVVVWCKETSSICIIDIEHDELAKTVPWEEFSSNPVKVIMEMWDD